MASQTSNELEKKLLVVLAIAFDLYSKCHLYHFDVIGANFKEDHAFLKELYEELNDQFDTVGEILRQRSFLVPINFQMNSSLPETDATQKSADLMFDDISKNFDIYKLALVDVWQSVQGASESGTRAAIENIMIARDKSHWMIRARLGEV